MNSENEMGLARDHDSLLPSFFRQDSVVFELREEGVEVDDDTVSNDVEARRADDSTRQDVKVVLLSVGDNGVSSIVSSLASRGDVNLQELALF